jgi:hypothetical protein
MPFSRSLPGYYHGNKGNPVDLCSMFTPNGSRFLEDPKSDRKDFYS